MLNPVVVLVLFHASECQINRTKHRTKLEGNYNCVSMSRLYEHIQANSPMVQ